MAENGTEIIKRYVKQLPHRPGVYRMLDEAGKVLYVGKARDLKNRVSNYTSLAGKNNRLATMITQTASMEFVTTRNESEALLLEANLIKKLEPRYNILLRDGKSFPFLLMTKHDFPRISKYRGTKNDAGSHFGPFASVGDVNKVLTQLQRVFLLRPCSDSYFNARQRPCLQYQIKRCSAPCVDYISKADYAETVKQAKRFLRGKSRDIQENLVQEMQAASAAMEYEKAAQLRDRLKALTQIQQEQGLYFPHVKEADVVALARLGNTACLQVFFYRDGQNFGNQPHYLTVSPECENAEVIAAFLPQFYQHRTAPRQILLSEATADEQLLSEALSATAGHKVHISVPQRGDKAQAMQQVVQNAKQALQRHVDARLGNQAMLDKLAELFDLDTPPERIEVYDNSHISGTHAVGGMIVAGAEGFLKKHYRKFTIKEAATDDDFAMMREVISRRLKRFDRGDTPPLLLIDGGKGQLSAVKKTMQDLGLWGVIPVVAIAKGVDRNAGREVFHVPGKPEFRLPIHDPVLHYLQRLRDEAHRYAIGAHRDKRSSNLKKSELDTVPGIGAKRKKTLLQYFGSAKAVANASVEELAQIEGISQKTAQTIWNHFHG